MKKRGIAIGLLLSLLLPVFGAFAENGHLVIKDFPTLIRPGKSEVFRFEAAHEGVGSLSVLDSAGQAVANILSNLHISEGENSLVWNGHGDAMKPLEAGTYTLVLQVAEDAVRHPITIGDIAPQITQLVLPDSKIIPGSEWNMSVNVNMKGTLAVIFHVAEKNVQLFLDSIPQGSTVITWDGLIDGQVPPAGKHTLSVVFMDENGFAANQQHISLEVLEPVVEATPVPEQATQAPSAEATADPAAIEPTSEVQAARQAANEAYHYKVTTLEHVPEEDYGKDYWRLPVGDYNEEAIWKVMMQPITVLWGKDQRDTYKLRATKDESTKRENIVGEIGYEAQGVNILEQTDDGWSFVEVHNSSYGPDNRTRRGYGDTDALIRGYVRTDVLKVITPRTDYGILIDKLKQRMYIFKEGKIFTELLISTGVPTKQQPWNETPSGEFLMVSRTGDFNAGNLVCRMSMRINGGNLIHEVPYILNERTGYWDYSSQEAQLGQKASHGCIRVQRVKNNEGINMAWLWSNIKINTKVLVWDDDNRYYDYPDAATPIFYNPDGGKYYHLDQNCSSIKDRFLPLKGETDYASLDNDEHAKLTPCPYCNPPVRASLIDELNAKNGF